MFRTPRISFPLVAARWLLALAAILGTTLTAFADEDSSHGHQQALGGAIDLSDAVISIALDGGRAYVLSLWEFYAGWGSAEGAMLSIYNESKQPTQALLGSMTFRDGFGIDRRF